MDDIVSPQPSRLPGLYAALFDNSPDLIAVVDRHHVFQMVNPACAARYGKSPDEIEGSSVAHLVGDDVFKDAFATPLDRCFSGEPSTSNTWITFPALGRRYIEVRYFPLLNGARVDHAVAVFRDLTDQKASEDALRESEERYRVVADFTFDWEHWIGADGTYIYVSPSCERLTGYPPSEFLANPRLLEEIAHPDDRTAVARHLREEHQRTGAPRSLDFRIVTRTGEEKWISHVCQPVYDGQGHWLGWRGSNRDSTDRHRAEQELVQSEERFRVIFNSMSEGVVRFQAICDEQGTPYDFRYLDANPASERLLGMKREEMFSKSILEAYPNAEQFWIDALGKVAITGEPALLEEFNRVYGKWWRAAAFSTGERQVAAIFEDVSAQKQADASLRESEERFRRVFEDCPIGMVIAPPNGPFLQANPAFCRMVGYTEDELKRLTVRDITHPEDWNESRNVLLRLSKGDISDHVMIEKRYVRKNGGVFWGRLTATMLGGHDDEPIRGLAMLEDMTEQKKSEHLREQYVSFISHDLRAPLSVVIGQASILRSRLADKGVKPEADRMESLLRSAWRMNSMIQDLTESSRLESGKLVMQKEPADLDRLVDSVCDQTIPPEQRARVQVESSGNLPSIEVDQEQFGRALANLVTNALKYSPSDSPVTISLGRTDEAVQILVTDHGTGIPPEEQPLVFDRFYRSVHRKKAEGLGLGLYITRLIVEAHGGRIWVNSTLGSGSTFGIALPVAAHNPRAGASSEA